MNSDEIINTLDSLEVNQTMLILAIKELSEINTDDILNIKFERDTNSMSKKLSLSVELLSVEENKFNEAEESMQQGFYS